MKRLALILLIAIACASFCFADYAEFLIGGGMNTDSSFIGSASGKVEFSGYYDTFVSMSARAWYQENIAFEVYGSCGMSDIFGFEDSYSVSLGYSRLLAPSWFASLESSFVTWSGDTLRFRFGASVLNPGAFMEFVADYEIFDARLRFEYLQTHELTWIRNSESHNVDRDENYRMSFEFGYRPEDSFVRVFAYGEYNWAENLRMWEHDDSPSCTGHNKKYTEISPLRSSSITIGAQLRLGAD